MIYLCGDVHGKYRKLKDLLLDKIQDGDTGIVVGDFGFVWQSDKGYNLLSKEIVEDRLNEENKILDLISLKCKGTLMFIDGNHENFDRLYDYPVVEKFGGKVHQIRNNIFHMMRGEIFEIENNSFLAFGGAFSHDIGDGIVDPTKENAAVLIKTLSRENKSFRIKGISWWEQEIPTDAEMEHALLNVAHYNKEIDYILTHQGSVHVENELFPSSAFLNYKAPYQIQFYDFLRELELTVKFGKWRMGHYHVDAQVDEKISVLYRTVEEIKGREEKKNEENIYRRLELW